MKSLESTMNIEIFTDKSIDVEETEVEIVERKGVGHPDSLADIIAESFSNAYSKWSLEQYGNILNHWFDKVLISGGEATLNPGSAKIIKKPRVYLFGKVTKTKNSYNIIKRLFSETVFDVFNTVFGISKKSMPDISIDVNSGVGAEHSAGFYNLQQKSKKGRVNYPNSNDTVFCNGYAPYTKLELYTCDLENYLNSENFKKAHPYTGFDVKILAKRIRNSVEVTVCIPFIAKETKSWSFYKKSKNTIRKNLIKFTERYNWSAVVMKLNTKDQKNRGYLTVYGTALDKGDFGVVGRGNRFSGFISANRGETQEAYHGKNPTIHSGKIFTVLSHRIARKIYYQTKAPVKVSICIDNGTRLKNPKVLIFLKSKVKKDKKINLIKNIAKNEILSINAVTHEIISARPIEEFKFRNILSR